MTRAALRWGVAGGGTGGHITPALALAERIRERGDSVFLLGSSHGLETRLVPEANFELESLPSRQWMGQGALARLRAGWGLLAGCRSARRALRRRRTQILVSVGGYASVPAVVAAATLRIRVALVEPNARPGRANRLLAPLATRIFVQFQDAAAMLRRRDGDPRLCTCGIPLRKALVAAFERAPQRAAPRERFRLLVFGGSQGARQVNDTLVEAARELDPERIAIFHQTGEADRERVEDAYRAAGIPAEVVDFERDMPRRYREADLAICRAGALTVAELCMAGLPALLVPYPFAADDHQAANAQALADAGAARILSSRPLEVSQLLAALRELMEAPETLQAMGRAAAARARPGAAERIVQRCAELVPAGAESA